ncbi:hypothetical protein GGR52DRAFT_50032 [Hypoxylon sp. FL1284]|nr:hypothetical protein GGR52DRAFT_50032 [Hypoxylon sp. FL1284]
MSIHFHIHDLISTYCSPVVSRLASLSYSVPSYSNISMEPRFPIGQSPDPAVKQGIEEALVTMHGGPPPFKWVEEDGKSLIGCYAPLSHTPQVAKEFFVMGRIVYTPDAVKPRNRELAILGLSSVLDVPYVVYCHRAVAPHVGLTAEQYEEGLAGKTPQGLSEEESTAYQLGRTLTTLTGPLGESAWRDATSKMTKAEFMGIVHTIAGYRWVALLEQVNGKDERWK